jgi:hypothetical protein
LLRASDEDVVRAFLAGAGAASTRGPRHAAMTLYYAAFVQDPDGNKPEAALQGLT